MALGERIRTLRKERSWSQGDLGERIGTDPGRISRYESGRITPSADALVRIAEALDVSCDYLLVDDAPRRPLHTPDHHLGERFNHLEELDEEDLSSLLNHLDGLIAKKHSTPSPATSPESPENQPLTSGLESASARCYTSSG